MADLHLIYGVANYNGREAMRNYELKYHHRKLPCHVFVATLYRRLCKTGSWRTQARCCSPTKNSVYFSTDESVLQALKCNLATNIRVLSHDTNIPQTEILMLCTRWWNALYSCATRPGIKTGRIQLADGIFRMVYAKKFWRPKFYKKCLFHW